jgi:hypothetical protein
MPKAAPYILLLLFLFLFSETRAQIQFSQETDTIYLKGNKRRVNISFKLINNLVVIPVKVNNSSTMNFILDSGVKTTLITRLYYSDSLELNEAHKIEIAGLGVGSKIEALQSKGNEISLNGIEGNNQDILVLAEDVFDLSSRMGMKIHGIIGYAIFKNFVVQINYTTKVLTLYRPDYKLPKRRRTAEYPLHIEANKAYVYANIKQHNGDSVNVKLVLDTGASNTVSLYLPSNDKITLPPKVMEAYLGRGLSGDINGKIGRLASFNLGKFQLLNLPASYPDVEAIQAALNVSNRNGNLGSDILSRFKVVIDYPQNRLLLLPNRKFKKPFHYNMAGFEVITPMPGANIYVISAVSSGSPASEAGIKIGDQLVDINGHRCVALTLSEILEMVENKPGKKINMSLIRDSEKLFVTVVLKSEI